MKNKVDLILTNAVVYSVNESFEIFESFAVHNNKFVATGSSEEILKNYESENILDAQGKYVFPGFIDAHCHFYGLGITMQQVNLVGSESEDEMLDRIKTFQEIHQTTFIKGRGWDQTIWANRSFPTKFKLDQLFPKTPVAVNRIDGHAMLVNTAALKLAGIDKNTKIEGGEIENVSGELTGILIDNAMNLVNEVMPRLSKFSLEKALKDAQEKCFSYGLTSVHDADLKQDVIELIEEMHGQEKLKIRMYTMIYATDDSLDFYLSKEKIKTDKLNVGAFKIYMDGALGSQGALLKKPYQNKTKNGVLVTSLETLKKYAERIANSNFQLNVHAIGDKANHLVLKTFVEDIKITKERRWRVEHAQIVDEIDFEYFKTVLASVQSTHATSDMHFVEKWIGKERMKGAYAYKRLLNLHGKIALGTDFPIEKVNPFLTFYAAVARKKSHNEILAMKSDKKAFRIEDVELVSFSEEVFQIENALSREETLKGMTIWAAYAAFEENEKGSIEKDKFADFVVLDRDIMRVDIEQVPNTKVLKTYIGGELVYTTVN